MFITDAQKIKLFDYMVETYNSDLRDFADDNAHKFENRKQAADYLNDDITCGCGGYTCLMGEIAELLGRLSDFDFEVSKDNDLVKYLENLQKKEKQQKEFDRITNDFGDWANKILSNPLGAK